MISLINIFFFMLGLLFGIFFVIIVSAVIVGSEAEENLIDKEDK